MLQEAPGGMKQFESFVLDTSNECLWRSGVQLALPPKPFAVLRYLVENPGRLITHDELLDALWPETYVQPQVLRTYMLDLRKALGDDATHPRFIQTLPKRGYCFVAPVTDGAVIDRRATPAVAPQDARASALVGREEELSRLKPNWRCSQADSGMQSSLPEKRVSERLRWSMLSVLYASRRAPRR